MEGRGVLFICKFNSLTLAFSNPFFPVKWDQFSRAKDGSYGTDSELLHSISTSTSFYGTSLYWGCAEPLLQSHYKCEFVSYIINTMRDLEGRNGTPWHGGQAFAAITFLLSNTVLETSLFLPPPFFSPEEGIEDILYQVPNWLFRVRTWKLMLLVAGPWFPSQSRLMQCVYQMWW